MEAHAGGAPRAVAAPYARGPNAPRVRRMRAADQGPFDWLVPFIPPVLRVNRETREAIRLRLEQLLSMEALAEALRRVVQTTKLHWSLIATCAVAVAVWVGGLAWMERNAPEFTTAYAIFSGFIALGYHLLTSEDNRRADGMSAYSVFNRGARRMLGSLSAEQFENEIRHRQPGHEGVPDPQDDAVGVGAAGQDEDALYDEDDPDLMMALQLSLQEKKREERRARRTSRRR